MHPAPGGKPLKVSQRFKVNIVRAASRTPADLAEREAEERAQTAATPGAVASGSSEPHDRAAIAEG